LRNQLDGALRNQLAGALRNQRFNYFAGQHWCAWEVFCAFCGEIGVRYTADESALLDLWLRQSRELHWWFPYEGIVLASERHTSLHLDDRGRLHSPDTMACAYGDSWGVYAWHGTVVPERYYKEPASASELLGEQNAEVRRALMERYDHEHGKGAFISGCGAKLIDSAVQPMRPGEPDAINELLSINLPGDPDGRILFLKMIDPSTGREYFNRVHPSLCPLLGNDSEGRPKLGPPQALTVRNALASTHGLLGEQYVLEAES
jgi:hypothetical protein